MRVYLVRHAIAHERDNARWPQDSLRPLTADGERRFRKGARGLSALLPRSAVVLTSPFVRARKTAEILTAVAQLRDPADCPALAQDEPPHKVFEALGGVSDKEIVLVGHEPGLGKLLAAMLAGDTARLAAEFKKGGAACVEFRGRVIAGRGKLIWHLPPRMLRALR